MDSKLGRALIGIGTLIAFVILWQLCVELWHIKPYSLPSPLDIADRFGSQWERLLEQSGATLLLAVKGIGLGIGLGVLSAIALHLIPGVRSALSPIIVITQNIPLIALGPLLIIWFGFGIAPKLVLITLVCYFPIAWPMLAGLGQAEPQLREYLKMIGASRLALLLRLELPASLPYFFSGLKITATYSIMAAIVAEWLGASKGIGYYLVLKSKGYDTTSVFAAIVCIVTMSLAFYGLAVLLERLVVRWRPAGRDGRGGGTA